MPDADYIQRVQEELGRRPRAAAVTLDLGASAAAVKGSAIAGWWCAPATPGLCVLPNPWDDLALLAEYDERAWSLVEATLPLLTAGLNDLHGLDRPADYWEVLLAPWMLVMAAVVLDRRLFLITARAIAPAAPVLVGPNDLSPARSTIESVSATRRESFNRALMGELADVLGMRTEQAPGLNTAPATTLPNRSVGERLRAVASNLPQTTGYTLSHSLLGGLHGRRLALVGHQALTFRQLLALCRAVPGVRAAPHLLWPGGKEPDLSGPPGEHPRREALAGQPQAGDGEEMLLKKILPRLLPRSLVEGYDALVRGSRTAYGPASNVLHGNYSYEDVPNEFAARSVSSGKRIAFAQHGGCALTLKIAPAERHEQRAGSLRLTWGGSGAGVRAIPSPYVQRLLDTHKGGELGVIIEPPTSLGGYVLRFSTVPIGNQLFEEQDLLLGLLQALGRDVRERLALKRFPGSTDETLRPAALRALAIPRRLARRPAVEWMRRARLAILPYPDTPFIEAMAIGVPVIGIWNPDRWGMRADAQDVFDNLAELGVVHRDPEAAAAKIERVFPDAQRWWSSPDVQAGRLAFLDRFAVVGDWLGPWADALREIESGTEAHPGRVVSD